MLPPPQNSKLPPFGRAPPPPPSTSSPLRILYVHPTPKITTDLHFKTHRPISLSESSTLLSPPLPLLCFRTSTPPPPNLRAKRGGGGWVLQTQLNAQKGVICLRFRFVGCGLCLVVSGFLFVVYITLPLSGLCFRILCLGFRFRV